MNQMVSLLRIVSMSYICLYHCICFYGIWNFFSGNKTYEHIDWWRSATYFVLDVFAFISGYLFAYLYIYKGKYRNKKDFIKKKALHLLMPYFIFSGLGLLMFPSKTPILDLFCGVQHLWFLLMLFGIFVIMSLCVGKLTRLSQLKQMGGGILITTGCAFLLSVVPENTKNIFCWKMIVQYLPVFFVGILMAQRRWNEFVNRWNPILFMTIMLVSIFITAFFLTSAVLPYGSIYNKYPIYVTLVLMFSALSRKELHLPIFVLNLEKYSMGIYIIHHLLIWTFLFYCPQAQQLMNEYYILAPLILFVIVYFVFWGTTYLIKRNKYFTKFI